MFSLWNILGASMQEEDTRTSEEANQFNRLLQESTNIEEILLHSQFNSFVDSRAIQLDKFLRKEGVIEKLVELLISSKDIRISNAASKVFSSKFAFVKSTVINNEELLNLLFQDLIYFSTSNIHRNPDNNSNIASTLSSLLLVHKWELVEYITSKISKDNIHHILNFPTFLLTLLDQDICSTTIKLTKWTLEIELIPLLITTFISGEEHYEEAAEALIQLTSFESKLQESLTRDSIESLIRSSVSPNPKLDGKWVVSQVLSILSNIVESSQGVMYSSEVPDVLQPIVDHIPHLIKSLDDDPSALSIQNTVGVIEPFGMTRMKIVSLISNLLKHEQRAIQEKLIESHVLLVLLKLVIKYKWNNILHTKVVEIIESILSTNIGFEINLLEQSNIHTYVAEMLLECHNVKTERNEVLPFTSIFEKIATIIIQYADNTALDDLEKSDIWRQYRHLLHGEDPSDRFDSMEDEEAGCVEPVDDEHVDSNENIISNDDNAPNDNVDSNENSGSNDNNDANDNMETIPPAED